MCLLQFSGHALERMGQYDLSYDDVYFATNHGTVMKDKPTGTEVQFLARDLSVCGAAQHINIVGVTVVIAPDDDTVVTVYRCTDPGHAHRRCGCYATRVPRKQFHQRAYRRN